jgi:hypothetical protein
MFPLGTGLHGRLSRGSNIRRVFETQPVCNFLRIEATRTANVEARQLSTSGHAVDVLVIALH